MELIKRTTLKSLTAADQPLSVVEQFGQRCAENIDLEHLNLFLVFTWISLVFYVLDIVIELYWLIHFFSRNYYWCLGCTLAFWIIPVVLLYFRSVSLRNERKETYDPRDLLSKEESDFRWAMKWVGPFCPIPRYWDIIKYGLNAKQAKKTDDDTQSNYLVAMIWEEAELLQLHQFDYFMESAVHLSLHFYVTATDSSQFGGLTAICLFISVLSLSWAIVSHDQKICLLKGIRKSDEQNQSNGIINFETDDAIDCIKNIDWRKSVRLFFAHFFLMVGRLIAFTVFASSDGSLIWIISLARFLCMFHCYWEENYYFMAWLRLAFLNVITRLYPMEKMAGKLKHPEADVLIHCFKENALLMYIWSSSLLECDERTKHKFSSILYYPWSDWTFFVPWIGQIFASVLTFVLF